MEAHRIAEQRIEADRIDRDNERTSDRRASFYDQRMDDLLQSQTRGGGLQGGCFAYSVTGRLVSAEIPARVPPAFDENE